MKLPRFHRYPLIWISFLILPILTLSLGTLCATPLEVNKEAAATLQDPHGTLAFAEQELRTLVTQVPGDQAITFRLAGDAALPPFQFAIQRAGNSVTLSGKSPSEILTAAYTALEQMGYRFEVTGPIPPKMLRLSAISEQRVVTIPAVSRRGVRTHINFNMDVSSYPLDEAKEYIRNLARLRYNAMSFHSYSDHWTRDRYSNGALFGDFKNWMKAFNPKPDDLVTGGYFYGGEFKVPDHPLVKPHIRFNTKYFCAPEFEEVIHTQPERGQKAQAWLRDLMTEAKRCGITIQFSTELRVIDNAYNEGLADRIMEDYPMVDLLEFVSAEAGDFRNPQADTPANQAMAEEIITGTDEEKLRTAYGIIPKAPLCHQIRFYANNIRLIRYLQEKGWDKKHNITLVCGSYACRPESVSLEMGLATQYLPANQILAIMPGHSSLQVASYLREANLPPDILKRLLIHSWMEFDGYMMLQQQSTKGLDDVVRYLHEKTGAPAYGLVCNHWRTTPNALSFRYLDEASMGSTDSSDGMLDPQAYFLKTAKALGIADAQAPDFAKAMSTIDSLSDVSAIAGNIGFNLGWVIPPGSRETGNIWWWGRKPIENACNRFNEARSQLESCRKTCTDQHGQAVLDELINGTACSVQHLCGVLELKTICEKYLEPGAKPGAKDAKGLLRANLTPAEKADFAAGIDKADNHFQSYLKLLGSRVADRGEEGMLVTYYWGPVVFCHNLGALNAGKGDYIPQNAEDSVVPQPLTLKDEKAINH